MTTMVLNEGLARYNGDEILTLFHAWKAAMIYRHERAPVLQQMARGRD